MSEQGSGQERTEEPTAKRRQEAKRKGQVPRSRELSAMAVMATAAAVFSLLGGWMIDGLGELIAGGLSAATDIADPAAMGTALAALAFRALLLLAPLFLALIAATVAAPAAMGGLLFSAQALVPKLERLSPMTGIRRIFSVQGLNELVKTLLKFALLSGLSVVMLWSLSDRLLGLSSGEADAGLVRGADYVRLAFFVLCGGMLVIAALDAPVQLWNHLRQLRMTRQELKDELKESEGNPEVRGRIRRLQQELASRKMMSEVPDADVVITNPTHYAVALRYRDKPNLAPRVIAKGRDLVAARIRELAAEHGVSIVSVPLLARAIYFNSKLGQQIPEGLYLAVARVLAYVFQLRAAANERSPAGPAFPADLPIPDELLATTGVTDER